MSRGGPRGTRSGLRVEPTTGWQTMARRILAVCEETTTPVPRSLGTRRALPGGQSVAGRLWTV